MNFLVVYRIGNKAIKHTKIETYQKFMLCVNKTKCRNMDIYYILYANTKDFIDYQNQLTVQKLQ